MEPLNLQKLGALALADISAPVFIKPFYDTERMQRDRDILWIESDSFLQFWKTSKSYVIAEPGPLSGWAKDQQQRVIAGLTGGPAARVPVASFSYFQPDHFGFTDGRHRTRAMIDFGAKTIPLDMSTISADNLIRDKVVVIADHWPATHMRAAMDESAEVFHRGSPYYVVMRRHPYATDPPIREVIALCERAAELNPLQTQCEQARSDLYKKFGLDEPPRIPGRAEWDVPTYWNAVIYSLTKLEESGAVAIPYIEGVRFPSNPMEFTVSDIERWHETASAALRNNGIRGKPGRNPVEPR